MTRTILSLKHWQIWLVFILVGLVVTGIVDGILVILDLPIWTPEHQAVSEQFTTPLIFIYPIVVGNKLRSLSSLYGLKNPSPAMVVLVGVFFITVNASSRLLVEQTSVPLNLSVAIILFASLLALCSYPARQLKTIEFRREAGFWEYIPETFQFLFWPIGVFWLQPRLNRLDEKAAIARHQPK